MSSIARNIFLTLVSGILLDIPALVVFIAMLLFRIHYSLFFGKSWLLFIIQLKGIDYFPELIDTSLFIIMFIIVVPVFFYIYNIHLFTGKIRIPVKSVFLFVIMMILEMVYFTFSVQAGLRYQGNSFVIFSIVLNAVFICTLFYLLFRNFKNASFMTNLLFNYLLIFWFSWFAFPFFGEMGF